MTDLKTPWWMPVLGTLLFAAVFAGLGWAVRDAVADADMATAEKGWAKAEKSRADRLATTLTTAQKRGDQLALQVNDLSNTLSLFAEEKNREIARLATGRRCLDAGLVRVLNRPTDSQSAGAVPETAGQPVRPDAGAGADPDDGAFASDADVATWANTCRTRYDTCRGRLDAIRQFYDGEQAHAR
ncbi:hypothetical protein [Azonexus fungiphilus]|uniref:hypothetical protein n=1 Tax=Azonexus fungiphilus TaxID=146940 RepID=UPI00156BBF0A|nr:hypothetical protein [Azonexus fungiphilus]NHC05907.1 hypothetical protein [Azonexus fungiphilus]